MPARLRQRRWVRRQPTERVPLPTVRRAWRRRRYGRTCGCSHKEALAYIIGKPLPQSKDSNPSSSSSPSPPPPARPAKEEKVKPATTTADAMKLWRPSVDGRGTPVERYLNQRKLELEAYLAVYVLRWHPGIGAMLGAVPQHHDRRAAGDLSHLPRSERAELERKFFGPITGAAVMLDPFEDVLGGLHIGAGVGTCTTAQQHPRMNFRPTWALGSDNAITTFPVLGGVESLTLIQEMTPKTTVVSGVRLAPCAGTPPAAKSSSTPRTTATILTTRSRASPHDRRRHSNTR